MHGHYLILENKDRMRETIKGGLFVEIGSCREAGSTKVLAEMAKKLGMHFITVDPDEGAYKRSKDILSKIDETYEAIQALGEKWLDEFEGELHLIYMDAFDNVLEHWKHKDSTIKTYSDRGIEITNENSWTMHLEASKAALIKVVINGFICFDDTALKRDGWYGKGKLAVPYLLDNGYEIVDNDYDNCVLLQRVK
jgi:hypothetical protein